jgi:transposase-like protein
VGAPAEVDAGTRPGITTGENEQIKALRREVAELRRANEILKAASAFFAAELDRPLGRSRPVGNEFCVLQPEFPELLARQEQWNHRSTTS